MERFLQSEELHKIKDISERIFDLKDDVIFFPIRHHSPVCSFHLLKTIEEYNPDAILIEGPMNTNSLIDGLTNDDNVMPLSIYYSYDDKKAYIDESKGKYRCYYPMLEHSPEYIALKRAKELDVFSAFIDLSYEEMLISTKDSKGLRIQDKKILYNDDDILLLDDYYSKLYKQSGVRDFHEFWEKMFEMRGLGITTKEFIVDMLMYCHICRETNLEDNDDISILREKHMALKVYEYSKKYKRVLVVTGGYHTRSIYNLYTRFIENEEVYKHKKLKEDYSSAYIIPYSYESSDALSGYKSGMPYTAFYSKLFKNILVNESSDSIAYDVFYDTVKHFVAKASRELRKGSVQSSTDDGIQAMIVSKGLQNIREKNSIGIKELIEGFKTAFIKGEYNKVNSEPENILIRTLVGSRIGAIAKDINRPPIVDDFKTQCRDAGIGMDGGLPKTKMLEIQKRPKHLEVSFLLHRIAYMNVGFCKLLKGRNIIQRKDLFLKNETWEYRWSPAVEHRLIEVSVHGATIKEACVSLLKMEADECGGCSGESAVVLLKSLLMGIDTNLKDIIHQLNIELNGDYNLLSIVKCANILNYIKVHRLYDVEIINSLIKDCYRRSCELIPTIWNVGDEEAIKYVEALKVIHDIVRDNEDLDRDVFIDSMDITINKIDINPTIEGSILGLLYALNHFKSYEVLKNFRAYIDGSGKERKKASIFLRGLFLTARDILLNNNDMIDSLDNYIMALDRDEFMMVLPELRFSFGEFTPREINDIAERVSDIYDTSDIDLVEGSGIDESIIIEATSLDRYAHKRLIEWGVMYGD